MVGLVPAAIYAAAVGLVTLLFAQSLTARGAFQKEYEVTEKQKTARRFMRRLAIIATLTGSVVVLLLFTPDTGVTAVIGGLLATGLVGALGLIFQFLAHDTAPGSSYNHRNVYAKHRKVEKLGFPDAVRRRGEDPEKP